MSGRLDPILITGSDPAANTEFSVTVPAGERWVVKAVTVSCAQGITQTPQPSLIIDDGTTTVFQGLGASSAQNASVTCQYTWAPGLTLTAGAANTVANAPPARPARGQGRVAHPLVDGGHRCQHELRSPGRHDRVRLGGPGGPHLRLCGGTQRLLPR